MKIKTPWLTEEERKRMEILVVDIERCIQHYPDRAVEYSTQLRNLRSELEFDK